MIDLTSHKQIVQECSDNTSIRNILNNSFLDRYCDNKNKSPQDFSEMDLFLYLTQVSGSSISRMTHIIIAWKRYYEYLQEISYRKDDPADYINARIVVEYTQNHYPYYTDEEINSIFPKLEYNKIFSEALIRSYYEGVVPKSTDLYELNYSDVDFTCHNIKTKRGTKSISGRLSDIYRELRFVDAILGDTKIIGRQKQKSQPTNFPRPDSLFPISGRGQNNGKLFFSRRIDAVSQNAGMKLTPLFLYYNGFINSLIGKYGLNMSLIMLDTKNDKTAIKQLTNFADEYLFIVPANKIRTQLLPMIIELKSRRC